MVLFLLVLTFYKAYKLVLISLEMMMLNTNILFSLAGIYILVTLHKMILMRLLMMELLLLPSVLDLGLVVLIKTVLK